MSREPGYFWVKYQSEWTIAQYRLHPDDKTFDNKPIYFWSIPAYLDDSWWHTDADFEEIDENRITRQHEKESQKSN